jgi:hypothetical protein
MALPDPQILADAHNLIIFASAVSQSSVQLISGLVQNPDEHEKLKAYFSENLPKLETIVANLKNEILGNKVA